jgi:hypothetical protein
VQVSSIQGAATFPDLDVAGFTTAVRNRFIAEVAGVVGVDARFVRIISLSAGSVVVDWSVAVPKDSIKSVEDLSEKLTQRLMSSDAIQVFGSVIIVSATPLAPLLTLHVDSNPIWT